MANIYKQPSEVTIAKYFLKYFNRLHDQRVKVTKIKHSKSYGQKNINILWRFFYALVNWIGWDLSKETKASVSVVKGFPFYLDSYNIFIFWKDLVLWKKNKASISLQQQQEVYSSDIRQRQETWIAQLVWT